MLPICVAAAGMVLTPIHTVRTHGVVMAANIDMPEQLEQWGCDEVLWNRIPKGAVRDMARFAEEGKEDLAKARMSTMREILTFQDAEPEATWEDAVATWEKDEQEKLDAKVKAEKEAKQEEKEAS